MNYIATVTQKGQVTIPIDIRKFLDVKPYDKVVFKKEKGQVVVKATKSFLDLEGSIKSKVKYSDKKANEAVLKLVAEQYAQKEKRSRR